MSSTISRAPPPILFTASHEADVACFVLEKLEDLWGQGLVGIDMQSLTMMLTSLLPNILILPITDIEFDALCPISGSNAIAAKDTKCVAFPNLALSTPMALMNVFPLSVFVCLKHTLTVLLILTSLARFQYYRLFLHKQINWLQQITNKSVISLAHISCRKIL